MRLNLDTMTEELRRPISDIYPEVTLLGHGVVDARGDLFVFGNTTGTRIVKIEGDSLSATADALIGRPQRRAPWRSCRSMTWPGRHGLRAVGGRSWARAFACTMRRT